MGNACVSSASATIQMVSRPAKKENKNFVLLWETGSGKSTTGNTILDREAFKTSSKPSRETVKCQLECCETKDQIICVVDTPGLHDTMEPNDVILKNIYQAMSLCPDGFDALIFVIPYGEKFTKESQETLSLLKKSFGEDFIKDHGILAFTRGDNFKRDNKKYNTTKPDYTTVV